jgi:hypothetical protein
MMELGATNYDETFTSAAGGGYEDIVAWMIKLGGSSSSNSITHDVIERALLLASINGREKIFDYISGLRLIDYKAFLKISAIGESVKISDLIGGYRENGKL